jgi:hypothetical protein
MGKILCTATGILNLEEWTHAEKLAAISRRAKLVRADGLEGRRVKMSELLALYVKSLRCLRC